MSDTVTLYDILMSNRLLKQVADGLRELDPDSEGLWPYTFPTRDQMAAGFPPDNYIGDMDDYKVDEYVGFHPPSFILCGSEFFLVGRYIIVSCQEIDSSYLFIPEGDEINRFETAAQAKARFDAIAAQVDAIHRLIRAMCTCAHDYHDHRDFKSSEYGRCRIEGCACTGIVPDHTAS